MSAAHRAEADRNRAAGVGLRSERGPLLLAIMLSTSLIALDATILATAVPSIVEDLGSFSQYPWLFSAYLLTQAVSVPLYSKLADTIGRKPIMLLGIGLFLASSVLAGFAWNMASLILFRGLQGLGAGAVGPMGITMIGDLYTTEERAKVQGYIASVWATASVVGPALGGIFAQYAGWPWIFFANIPLALMAGWLILTRFDERVERRGHRIDCAGAAVLTFALTCLILCALEGGHAWAWASWPTALTSGIGLLALVAFARIERRAPEPIIDVGLITRRLILTTTLLAAGIGALMVGITSFVPLYLEKTAGATPLGAGFAVGAVSIGWPIAATNAGKLYLTRGFRFTVLCGTGLVCISGILLLAFSQFPNPWLMAAGCLVLGMGLGLAASPSLIRAQSSVGWGERAAVTGLNVFARSAGSALGVAVFGAIANHVLAAGGGEGDPETMVRAAGAVFIGVVVLCLATAAASWFMPTDEPEQV